MPLPCLENAVSSMKKWPCWNIISKAIKTFQTLKKIIRWIALFDAVIGTLLVILVVTRRSLEFHEKATTEKEKIAEIIKLTTLSLRGAQIIFAVILFEGARREIPCMIKAWLVYLLIKITFNAYSLSTDFASRKLQPQNLLFTHADFNLRKTFKLCVLLFDIFQFLLVIIFQHHLLNKQKKRQHRRSRHKSDDSVVEGHVGPGPGPGPSAYSEAENLEPGIYMNRSGSTQNSDSNNEEHETKTREPEEIPLMKITLTADPARSSQHYGH